MIYNLNDERQETTRNTETMLSIDPFFAFRYDFIPFFQVYRIYWYIQLNQQKHIYLPKGTCTCLASHLCHWIATNSIKYSNSHEHQLDIRFEFHFKQHSPPLSLGLYLLLFLSMFFTSDLHSTNWKKK